MHDFAFVVARNFVDQTEYVEREDGSRVEIHYLVEQAHHYQVPRFHEFMKTAFAKFERYVGPYPYQTLTVVFWRQTWTLWS